MSKIRRRAPKIIPDNVDQIADGRWRFRYDGPRGLDGKRNRISVTRKNLEDLLQVRAEIVAGIARRANGLLFGDALADDLAGRKHTRVPDSFDRLISTAKHLEPIADVRIADLTRKNFEEFLRDAVEDGLRLQERNRVLALAKRVVTAAFNDGDVARNVLANIRPLKALTENDDDDVKFWTRVEIAYILQAAIDHKYGFFVRAGTLYGLRPGETLAIVGRQIQTEPGFLIVDGTMLRDGTRASRTKGKKRRRLPISPQNAAEFEDLAARLAPDELATTSPEGAPIRRSNFLRRQWRDLIDKAQAVAALDGNDVPYHGPHCLRHTFATFMLEDGAPLVAVSEWLGHANPEITLRRYAHATPKGHERARLTAQGLAKDLLGGICE